MKFDESNGIQLSDGIGFRSVNLGEELINRIVEVVRESHERLSFRLLVNSLQRPLPLGDEGAFIPNRVLVLVGVI